MADILKIARDFNPKKALTHIFDKIDEIIKKVNTLWANSPNVKTYEARLSQESTDAPNAAILVNTTGISVDWIYDVAGSYYLPLVGVDVSKISVQISSDTHGSLLSARPTTAFGNAAIFVYSTDITGTLGDDLINNATITFKIYP